MAQSMSDNQEARIQEHLQNRPIAPILAYYISHGNGEDSGERNNISVLKFMCVLDYYTEARGLYTRIDQSSHPKLRSQLLQFRDFERFKYYHYSMDRSKIGDRILKCKFCELIGAYAYILTHMTINHDVHIGLKICVYCEHKELTAHFDDDDLGDCFQNYLRRYEIAIDTNVCEIVDEFYRMLRILSKELKIYCSRDHRFAGIGHRRVEKLDVSYGTDFPNEVAVFRQNRNRSIQSRFLEEQFEKVISIQYGGNNASRLLRKALLGENSSVITVSSDEDDDDRTRNSANHLIEPIPLEQPVNEIQYPVSVLFAFLLEILSVRVPNNDFILFVRQRSIWILQ